VTVGDRGNGFAYHQTALVSPATMNAVATTGSAHLRNARDAVGVEVVTGTVNASDMRNRTVDISGMRVLRSFSTQLLMMVRM
jgi:hypothetical protein